MKHILKKIILVMFSPCLLISCSCSRGEYVDLPAFNHHYGLIYMNTFKKTYYTDYQNEYSLDNVVSSFYSNTYGERYTPREVFVKNSRLYGFGLLTNGTQERGFSGFCFDFSNKEINELFHYQESELLAMVKEKTGFEPISIESIKRGYADIDNFDCYFVAKFNETTKMNAFEMIIDINSFETIYFDEYIENQKDYSKEMEKRSGIEINNESSKKDPQYTKDGKTYVYNDDFFVKNSDSFETILKRMKYEGLVLLRRTIELCDGKLFIKFNYYKYSIMLPSYTPTFVFVIEPTTGYATYIGSTRAEDKTTSETALLLGAIHL